MIVKYKILLPVLLLSACLWHMLTPVYYTVYGALLKEAQQEMIAGGEEEELLVKQMSARDFYRNYDRRDRELYLDGDMYDVVSYEKKGDRVSCVLYHDREETEHVQGLIKDIHHKEHDKTGKRMASWMPAICHALPAYPLATSLPRQLPHFYLRNEHRLSSGHTTRLVRPPRYIACS